MEIKGIWNVTTEGDSEGRSVKNLGIFNGYIDEIALHLASSAEYSLRFKPASIVSDFESKSKSVNVVIEGIQSSSEMKLIENLFENRPVIITNGDYYSSFKITTRLNEEEIRNERIKREALSKLSDEEKKVLGL